MKNVVTFYKIFAVLAVSIFLNNFSASAQKTVVYIVRHAEKINGGGTDDPVLSGAGQQRADDLAKELRKAKIKAIYVTRYKRSGQTARPLAVKDRILPRVYADTNLKAFAKTIATNFRGNNVLIIGHSNTVMPLLTAFGTETPFDKLDEEDYDMLFKVILKDNGTTELEINYYGEKHHVNDIPEKYLPEIVHPEFVRPFN